MIPDHLLPSNTLPSTYQARSEDYLKTLLEDIVPFWTQHAVDREYGGFHFSLGPKGEILDYDKAVWIQGRFIWLLSTLYNVVEPRQEWLDLARHGVDFLLQHCRDKETGKYYFLVARDGTPLRMRRYAYSECFAAIGLAAFAKASGEKAYEAEAISAFENLCAYIKGEIPTDPKWTNRPAKGLATRMVAISAGQELRNLIGYKAAEKQIDWAMQDLMQDFCKPELETVMETVALDGSIIDTFDGRLLNPGHAIEAAWFMLEEATTRDLPEVKARALDIIRWMWKRGWDSEYGGMLYFRDVYGKPIQEYWHDMKFWWPQNETEIATLMAWRLTGDEEFKRYYDAVHEYQFNLFPDRDYLEWFGYFHRDGSLSSPIKGNHWKGPFHIPRMLLYGWQLTR